MKARSPAEPYLNSNHKFQTISEYEEDEPAKETKLSPTPKYIHEDISVRRLEFNISEKLDNVPSLFKSPNLYSSEYDPYQTFTVSKEFINTKNSLNQIHSEDTNGENLSYIITRDDRSYTIENTQPEATMEQANGFKKENSETSANIETCCKKHTCDNTDGWDKPMTELKEQAFARLQDELEKAHQELKLKDEEVVRLTRIREDVERELEDLTASLFQEAHKMVREANEKQAAAEKSLTESQMKVDVLTAEVAALKTLVLTSTPSRPNPHLHPQIKGDDSIGGVNLFNRKHRRSPSHFNLKYGRENSPPDSPERADRSIAFTEAAACYSGVDGKDMMEVDPNTHKEFLNWKQTPKLDKSDPFVARVYREDIDMCLAFNNTSLSNQVKDAIEARDIFIEAVTDKTKTMFPKKCALLEVPRQCHYRMKIGDQDTWYSISQICRNRIIAVCEFLNYLRYIELGLVKSSVHDVYWEMTRLRKEMMLARLGLLVSTA